MMFDLQKLIRPNIQQMKPYSSARDEFKQDGQQMTFLDANENPFDNAVNRYPDPQQMQLKTLIAQQKNVSTAQLFLGNGSDEVLDLIFRVFCEPGVDNIITLPPTYGMYNVLAQTNNIENRTVLLNSDFSPQVSAIFDAIDDKTKIIFFCSPNNPTGNVIAADILETVLSYFKGIIVIDEAYIDFSASKSWITALNTYPNLIITQTFSKAYGLAGIRLGTAYASPQIISILHKIKPPYNVNVLTQQKAIEVMRDTDIVKAQIEKIIHNRKQLIEAIAAIECIIKIHPSDANFVLVEVDNANLRYKQLLAQNIVVRNRTNTPLCENTLRFTVGTRRECEQLIQALQNCK